jgi:hypothetical protein
MPVMQRSHEAIPSQRRMVGRSRITGGEQVVLENERRELTPAKAWSRRVRLVGGLIQSAFAGFWLLRGSVVLGGATSTLLIGVFALLVAAVFGYAFRNARGTGPRPSGSEAKRLERAVTIATVIEFAAAFALPAIVIAAGHGDWVLPSIAITIGPLLLYLDHLLEIPRYRAVGWALTLGPIVLVASLSDTPLIATTGIASGLLLLGTAAAGFRELAGLRRRAGKLEVAAVVVPIASVLR